MHIPDGYLGPQTYAPLWAFMLAAWGWAGRVMNKRLRSYQVPLLAIGAAFSFVIMMFNIPIPGGTTGHATGAALITVILGPWAAAITMSVALIIQALLFGDGGITAIGANCFAMAVVLPFATHWTYRLISGRSEMTSRRRVVAAGVAGYVGLNASALVVAVLFGIQPMLAHSANGTPLYAPYPLSVAVPAMAVEHLLLFGFVEAAVTGLAFAYLQRSDVELLRLGMLRRSGSPAEMASGIETSTLRRLWIWIGVLAVLSPLGIIIPAWLRSGDAWGEWSGRQIRSMVGYVPSGMQSLKDTWSAMFSGYSVGGLGNNAGYALSAVVGILLVAGVAWLLGVALRLREKTSEAPPGTVSQSEGRARVSGLDAGEDPNAPPKTRPETPRLPGWLATQTDSRPITSKHAKSHRRADFVERTLREAGVFIKESLFLERWAKADGFLQSVDPRIKTAAAALLIITVSLVRHQALLWALYAVVFIVAVSTHIPAGLFTKRVWLFVPLFTAAIAAPAALNLVTPGKPLFVLLETGSRAIGPWTLPPVVAVTDSGLQAATMLVARVAASVSIVVLLTLTTQWADLLKALRALKVPALFTMVMEMGYRYVFVLVTMLEETHLAKRARTVAPSAARTERQWVGSRVGSMMQRSRKLTDTVYQAMIARGYDGHPRSIRTMRARAVDWIWAAAAVFGAVGMLAIDRLVS